MTDLFVRLIFIIVLVLLQLDSSRPTETALLSLLLSFLLLAKTFLVIVTLKSLRIFLFLIILIIFSILNIANFLVKSLILNFLFKINGIKIHDLIFEFP